MAFLGFDIAGTHIVMI